MMKIDLAPSLVAYFLIIEALMRSISCQAGPLLPTPFLIEGPLPPVVVASLTTGKPMLPPNVHLTRHFLERMAERGVSAEQVVDILRTGKRFYDPRYGESVWWKNGIYIPVANDGALKTIVRGPINRKWRPF